MSAFNLQGGQIRGALVAAGLPAAAATQISNVLSNCAQTLRHTGRIEVDRTPQNMRMVTPSIRKHSLPNLDFPQADPYYAEPLTEPSEDRPIPKPEPAVESTASSEQATRNSTFHVAGGPYTSAQGAGDIVQVGLRVQGFGRVATLDPPSNSIVGKSLRAASNAGDSGLIRFFVEETGQEIVFNLQLQNVEAVEVLTDVHYEEGVGLVLQYRRVYAWRDPNSLPRTRTIPVSQMDVVEDVRLDAGGLNVLRSQAVVLGTGETAPSIIPVDSCEPQ